MGRVTVWVPDELEATVREDLPGVNWSAATQAGLRALLECRHEDLSCTACGLAVSGRRIAVDAVTAAHRDLMLELRILVDRHGTLEGAARIAHRVAVAHGVADLGALPRSTRAAREAAKAAADVLPLPTEAAARHRHPTNHPTQETA